MDNLTQAEVEELEALLAKATPGPWKADVSAHSNGALDAHWSIQTVDKQPEHPWSPRFVAWMTGTLRSDLRVNDIPGAKYCRECESWNLGWREVGVDVRVDPKAEADAKLIAAMKNALPALLRHYRTATPSAEEWRPLSELKPNGKPVLLSAPGWESCVIREWVNERHMRSDLENWTDPPTHWATGPSLDRSRALVGAIEEERGSMSTTAGVD